MSAWCCGVTLRSRDHRVRRMSSSGPAGVGRGGALAGVSGRRVWRGGGVMRSGAPRGGTAVWGDAVDGVGASCVAAAVASAAGAGALAGAATGAAVADGEVAVDS